MCVALRPKGRREPLILFKIFIFLFSNKFIILNINNNSNLFKVIKLSNKITKGIDLSSPISKGLLIKLDSGDGRLH